MSDNAVAVREKIFQVPPGELALLLIDCKTALDNVDRLKPDWDRIKRLRKQLAALCDGGKGDE